MLIAGMRRLSFSDMAIDYSKGARRSPASGGFGVRDRSRLPEALRGMRQAGIIAAAALHALEHHRKRLADDHRRARRLAEALAVMPGAELDPATVETNIVMFRVNKSAAAEVAGRLREAGVWMLATGLDTIRAVTHLDVSDSGLERAIRVLAEILR